MSIKIGGTDWVRTSDLALMKPAFTPATTTNQAIIDEFVAYKKSTKGLTPRGEEWLRDMTGRFLKQLRMNLTDVGPQQIVEFLGPYSDRSFQRHPLLLFAKKNYRRLFAPHLSATVRCDPWSQTFLRYVGEDDGGVSDVRRCAKQLSDATLVTLPGLNHLESFYQADLVLPHVMPFLQAQPEVRE